MELTKEERDQLYICICCRLGIIETGKPMMRTQDAINTNQKHLIKPLSSEQMKLIISLEELLHKLLNYKEK